MSDEWTEYQKDVASLRMGLIFPLVHKNYPESSLTKCACRISSFPVKMPDGTERRFSHKTIMRWYETYMKSGRDLNSLMPAGRSDRNVPRALSKEAQERIRQLRAELPRISAVVIREKLVEEGLIKGTVSKSTVQRFVKKLKTQEPIPGEIKDRKAFEAAYCGRIWQADTKYFPAIVVDGVKRKLYMISIMDDYSRMIMGAELFYEDNADNVLRVLKKAVEAYGIPEILYTDHGTPYENNKIDFVCKKLGIELKHPAPRDAAAKGKEERLHRTLQDRCIDAVDPSRITSREEYNDILQNDVFRYTRTVHSTTKQTPFDRWEAGFSRVRQPVSAQWLEECFELRTRQPRYVRSDSTVIVDKVCYDVPPQFIGQRVYLYYKADKPDEFWLREDGKRYTVRKTDRIENGMTPRKKKVTIDYGLETDKR